MGEYEAVHTAVWEKLDKQAKEIYHLKKDNARLRDAVLQERKESRKLRKQLGQNKRRRRVIEQYRQGAGASE